MASVELSGLQELVFLDRYALKDVDPENLCVGDRVVVLVKDHPRFPERAVGKIVGRDELYVDVVTDEGDSLRLDPTRLDKPLELSVDQMWDRIANEMVLSEKAEIQDEVREKFRWLLDDFRFVPGGRIMASAGAEGMKTMLNCFVISPPHDSRSGILKTAANMIEIMARGGGVGILVSSLRPRAARVFGVNGRSNGSVAWAEIYSMLTILVNQDGGRRGALMLMENDWHPDLMEFIRDKTTPGRKEGCNMSVLISDRFMQALRNGEDWTFVYPDYASIGMDIYDREWRGDLDEWVEKGYPVKEYGKMPATEIWHELMESVWLSGEPGVIFIERANKLSNSWYYDRITGSNPCGEELLPANGICDLGHLVLPRFVKDGEILWEDLAKGVHYGVRFLDNVLDRTDFVLDEVRKQAQKERRIGLGTMGLGELLLDVGLRYGSDESIEFINKLYKFIAVEAYRESVQLAIEKGSFPMFDRDKFLRSIFVQRLPDDVQDLIYKHGIRHVTLLTQAPTGSGGTMVGTSTGIEPWFAWEYYRKGRFGSFKEEVRPVKEWREKNPGQILPDYFVTAMDLGPEEHVKVQATIQYWVDASISKTVNCPKSVSVDDVKKVYNLAYALGCKGVTLYRDGSRGEQVLNIEEIEENEDFSDVGVACTFHKTANGIERTCSV